MFAGQCNAKNGSYNCHRLAHKGSHSHHFASNGEHRVALWDDAYGPVKFVVVKAS